MLYRYVVEDSKGKFAIHGSTKNFLEKIMKFDVQSIFDVNRSRLIMSKKENSFRQYMMRLSEKSIHFERLPVADLVFNSSFDDPIIGFQNKDTGFSIGKETYYG